ncbi:MAG: WD40 repeat domain-containing protein [Candidatus Odinarchaeota archaeon]
MRRKINSLKYIIIWVFICNFMLINGSQLFILNGWAILKTESENSNKIQRYFAESYISEVVMSSDGQFFAARGENMLYYFNQSTKTPLWNYSSGGSGNRIRSVSISSNGQYIVTASDTGWTCLFDKDNSTPLWHHYDSSYLPYSAVISSNGQYIVAGIGNGSGAEGSVRYGKVCFFDKSSPIPLWNHIIGDWILSVAISSDGQYIVAGGVDNKVYLFENTSSTPLWSYQTGDPVESVAISSDGQYIIAGSADDKIYLFNNTSNTPLWNYSVGNSIYSLAISNDGDLIAVGGMWDGTVYLFNNTSNIPLWIYSIGEHRKIVAMSSDGHYISVGHDSEKVSLFYYTSNIPLWTLKVGYMRTISSNGNYVVAAKDNIIYLIPSSYKPPPNYAFVGDIVIMSIAIAVLVIFFYSLYYILKKRVINA